MSQPGFRPSRARRGFTLIELMIAIVVSSIVVLGIFAFSTIQRSTTSYHARNVRVQQALEGAMWSMAQDIRQSGLGFARLCTEIRVWDDSGSQLINPGAVTTPTDAATDPHTGEAYWVLRDGIQAHWDAADDATLAGDDESSAWPSSAADSLDVILAEANYTGSMGVFTLVQSISVSDTTLTVQTSDLLDNTTDLDQVQQLFPPGSFVLVARTPEAGNLPFRVESQGQCILLQITGDVAAGSTATEWLLPVDGTASGFNNLTELLADSNGDPACGADCDDWRPGTDDNAIGASVVPLGRLRWSRYEIDYTYATLPYLVRYDIIGFQDGVDPDDAGAVDYPHCTAGNCPMAQLHLPESADSPPLAVAIGPMIEDMQIAVGCDGYTAAGAAAAPSPIDAPDAGYEEVGPAGGVVNRTVDENDPDTTLRTRDEWLGNADDEQWAPDCVFYGTAQYYMAGWDVAEPADPRAFRMSPQTLRVTLVGSSEEEESLGGVVSANVQTIENRPEMASPVGRRQRFTLTERFTPANLRWRDPAVP